MREEILTPSDAPFHVVQIRFWGQHRGYEVWCRNRPMITLRDGLKLKRAEAYRLAHSFNQPR